MASFHPAAPRVIFKEVANHAIRVFQLKDKINEICHPTESLAFWGFA
jgi:hypothetical protein